MFFLLFKRPLSLSRRYFGSSFAPRAACLSDMDDLREEIYVHQYVHSPLNLNSFEKWAIDATEEQLDQVCSVIYTVVHRIGYDDDDDPNDIIINIMRRDLNRRWQIPSRVCSEAGCIRCASGRGGWQFRWVGPWTCDTLIASPDISPAECMRRAMSCGCSKH